MHYFLPPFTAVLFLHLAYFVQGLPYAQQDGVARRRADIIRHCTVPNTAALTFDDGPYEYVYEITRQLAAANASATFFLNGDNYGCIYDRENIARIRHIYNSGHQVASHTWAHTDLPTLSRSGVNDQMRRVDQAIQRITGAMPAFFRPPYGSYNNMVREVAAARGQSAVLWDFDSGDSLGVSASSQKSRYSQLARRRPSSILSLNHEVYDTTVKQVLPHALNELRRAGYRLVTVAECVGRRPYQSHVLPIARDATWRC